MDSAGQKQVAVFVENFPALLVPQDFSVDGHQHFKVNVAGAFHVDGNFHAKSESSGNAADSWLPAVSPEFISILVYIIHR